MSLFEDLTPEIIKNRILERIDTTMQTREGSFLSDMVSPVAFELWRQLTTLEELICAFYVDETSGAYLDKHAKMLGLERREGVCAEAVMTFNGLDGATIPAGTEFLTADGLSFFLKEDVTLVSNSGTGTVQAAEVGAGYNVDAGEIAQIRSSLSGLDSFENEAASGGVDREGDAELFERITFRRKHPSTSGNENHYQQWALSCDGVGGVKVTRLWNGPGTVLVLLAGYNGATVDETIVANCAAYIESQRPIGATVTVQGVKETTISVSATLTLSASASLEEVQAAFEDALRSYLQSLTFKEYVVHYNRIAALLMNTEGVSDFSGLLVNDGTVNIEIADDAASVLGEVTLT